MNKKGTTKKTIICNYFCEKIEERIEDIIEKNRFFEFQVKY